MQYPALCVDQKKLRENVEILSEFFHEKGKDFHLVTKCFSAYEPVLKVLASAGPVKMADSRIENMARIRPYTEDSLLLRIPMLSEVEKVVELCDLSLNSEWVVISALNDAAKAQGKTHGVILMLELGDRREGVLPEDVPEMVEKIMGLSNIRLAGVGSNFNCYGGVIPDEKKMLEMQAIAKAIEEKHGIRLDYVSGGNSGNLWLLEKDLMPEGVNHLRLGESYLLGRETSFGEHFLGLHEDVFTLKTEIVECKLKPSLPEGRIGLNALGEEVEFEDRGTIRRAIVALGAQDVTPEGLRPREEGVDFLGSSSDHSIFDITKNPDGLEVGDVLSFDLNYAALNRLFTSEYVHKYVL